MLESEKLKLIEKLGGRRTPQLRPQFESLIVAQKPKIGTFIENWDTYETGLMDASAVLDGSVPKKTVKQNLTDPKTTYCDFF